MKVCKLLILFLFFLSGILSVQGLSAQDYPHDFPRYHFLNLKDNHLNYFGDSANFNTIFKKLEDIVYSGKNSLDILHMGGSHIQAGVFSGEMRKQFQSMLPEMQSYRGFLFPYRVAGTNNPSNYHIRYWGPWESCRNVQRQRNCTLGLSGMSVTTYTPGSGMRISNDPQYLSYEYSSVRIYCDLDTTSFQIVPADSLYNRIINRENGYIDFQFESPQSSLSFTLMKTAEYQESFTLYGIEFVNSLPGIAYHTAGVNGADVPSYNRCELLARHIRAVSPDLIIFSIGINDAYTTRFNKEAFKRDYRELINTIQSELPDIKIIFTTNNDSYYRRRFINKNAPEVREAMNELARHYNAVVWDMFGVMGGLNSISEWQKNGLAKSDGIHFTREGYTLISNLFFSAFVKSFEHYVKANSSNQQ